MSNNPTVGAIACSHLIAWPCVNRDADNVIENTDCYLSLSLINPSVRNIVALDNFADAPCPRSFPWHVNASHGHDMFRSPNNTLWKTGGAWPARARAIIANAGLAPALPMPLQPYM